MAKSDRQEREPSEASAHPGITGPDGSYLAKLPLKGYVAAGSPAEVYFCWATRNYRELYGLLAVNSIWFNHESPRHGETFMTRNPAPYRGRQRGADRCADADAPAHPDRYQYWGVPASVRGVIDRAMGVCVE